MDSGITSTATLVVFCRRPALGVGKQRLARKIGAATAFEIASLLLETTLEDAQSWPGPVILAPAEAGDATWAAGLLGRQAMVIAQTVGDPAGGNLGERLTAVDRVARAQGYSHLVFVGSDAPVLSASDYVAARGALERNDVVLGPALDGGVTLMGARCPWPELADLPWGSEQLHAALRARCSGRQLRIATLPTRYDIDEPGDLARLGSDLATDQRPARQALYRRLRTLGYSGQQEITPDL